MPPWNLHRHPSKASSLQCFALPPLSADVLGVVLNKVPKRDTWVRQRQRLVLLCAGCLLGATGFSHLSTGCPRCSRLDTGCTSSTRIMQMAGGLPSTASVVCPLALQRSPPHCV